MLRSGREADFKISSPRESAAALSRRSAAICGPTACRSKTRPPAF